MRHRQLYTSDMDKPFEPGIAGGTVQLPGMGVGHPIRIVTWIGPGFTIDIWDNQSALKTCYGDEEDVDRFPSDSSVDKLRNCTVGYIHNHGGSLTTHRGRRFRVSKLGFSTAESEGPNVILFWGCRVGDPKYAAGFGVLETSQTKTYIGCKFDAPMIGVDSFQETFFLEFSDGNVTVKEACIRAYAVFTRNIKNPNPFEQMFAIIGNADLTLNQVRVSLDKRDIFYRKQSQTGGRHLCGAACSDFIRYGFCDNPVRQTGLTCHHH